MHNQFPDDQHRTAQEESEEVEAEGGQEERNYRPRVPTVQGQYENVREHLADEPPSNVNPTRRGGEARSHVTLSSEDLQAVREGLARAKRSLIAEGRDAMQSNRDNLQKSMRVIEGDMSQDIPDRSPQPQYEPGRHPSPHHEAARPFQPHQGHRHQLNFVADSRPQPPQESIGLPQNTREDLANQYMSEENGQNHFRQPQLRQDIIGHTRSYTEGSPKPPMPDEDLKTNLRSLSSQNDHHRQPQQQQYEIGQTHLFHEDHQGQQITEEVRQSQFRQIPPQHQVLGEPQPQEQPYRALDVRPDNPNPEDERQRQQQTLDQLYIQHMNLERNNYHREKQIVEKEISHRELLRHSEQERLWEEQRRQTHNRLPQEQPRTPPQHERMPQNQRTPGSGFEQRESGRHREEFIPYDERHPAWRDQRLPRGVNPKRYHIHNDL